MKHLVRYVALVLVISACTSGYCFAAAWPDNWLGPRDNYYRQLDVRVYYYGAVIHDLADSEGNPALPDGDTDWLTSLVDKAELSTDAKEAELHRIQLEMSEAVKFCWRNTRFNLALDLEWVIDLEPRLRSTIASPEGPYYSPVEHSAYDGMRNEFDGLVQIMVLYRYNKETGELERVRGGGGFTWGLDSDTMECGWSWWAACTADNTCGSDWLMVHEFGHQIDSMFEQSGHPEFWFNHLAPLEGNVATFGEHFDANSYILRRVPESDWHDLLWGTLREFSDLDHDAVPDSDEYLLALHLEVDPNPNSTDTDDDGLSDFVEFMAWNGIRHGHGERLHPGAHWPSPEHPDSDFDGIPDSEDPYPSVYELSEIPHIRHDSEFAPAMGMAAQINSPCWGFAVNLSYSGITDWEEDEDEGIDRYLMLETTPFSPLEEKLVEFKIMLDLDNDGWFAGNDNYQIMIENGIVSKVIQHQAGSSTNWPAAVELDPVLLGLDLPGYRVDWPDRSTVLRIEQQYFPELAAKPGEIIGFNIGIRTAGDAWFYMLGEPNTLIPLELR